MTLDVSVKYDHYTKRWSWKVACDNGTSVSAYAGSVSEVESRVKNQVGAYIHQQSRYIVK